MAGGGYGGRHSSGVVGRLPTEKASGPFQARTKRCLVITVACAVAACICALLVITEPCLPQVCSHPPCDDATNGSYLVTAVAQKLAPYHRLFASGRSDSATVKERGESVEEGDAYTKTYNTSLKNIVFGIAASSKLWSSRKHYVREWWQKKTMRGYVWLDTRVNGTWDANVPPFKISANTSQFQYSRRKGNRAALRLSRIVAETFRLGLKNVDWFVMGDDDTVFFTDNLVRMLSNYDPKQMHYIGSQSESHVQNTLFSYGMAYGGGGFAISYPLAKALAATQDGCLHRYPELFGSDDRIHACITELGVPITKNQGFHQFDIYGNPMGLLSAHPLTPLLSIHHLDVIGSLFPKKNRLAALRHLMKAARIEQASMLQQTITYSNQRRFSFSISSGYVVRVYRGFISPRELEEVPRTFYSWYGSKSSSHFPFNIREIPDAPCQQPTLFFLAERSSPNTTSSEGLIETVYTKEHKPAQNLTECDDTLNPVERIRVRSAPLNRARFEPRRLCGRVATWRNDTIEIFVRPCEQGELVIGPD